MGCLCDAYARNPYGLPVVILAPTIFSKTLRFSSLAWSDRFFPLICGRGRGFGILPLPVLYRESPDFGDC